MASTSTTQAGLRRDLKVRRFKGAVGAPRPVYEVGRVILVDEPNRASAAPALSVGQTEIRDRVVAQLDQAVSLVETDNQSGLLLGVNEALQALKSGLSEEDWQDVVLPAARAHPFAGHVAQCPLTRHSLTRPRGYPGDAGLLDLIYRHSDTQGIVERSSVVGRDFFGFTNNVSVCEAVRQRRQILAERIDQVATERPGADFLAVACGHLREAEVSAALRNGHIGRFVATDQDLDSLAVVERYRECVSPAIVAKQLSVRDFIAGKHGLEPFDFVYAAGLYDYLDDRIAMRLTRKLFSLLKPGGRLLVANFLTGCMEVPYMEAFMDWHLIYRSREQIKAFANEISDVDLAGVAYFEDSQNCIGYLELEHV